MVETKDSEREVPSYEGGLIFWKAFQNARPAEAVLEHLGISLGWRSWKRPKGDRLRVDVDALFDKEKGRFGVGVIVRDQWNSIKLAMARKISPSSSSVMAELKAVIHGVLLCMEHDTGPIEVFTDSIIVVRLLANPEEYNELLPEEICEIFTTARRGLLLDVFHAYRSAMRAAHTLAQFSSQIVSPVIWTCNFPTWLGKIVDSDVNE